jgi:hypothetical protein
MSLNAPLPDQEAKRKDYKDDEEDKSGAQGFQQPTNERLH